MKKELKYTLVSLGCLVVLAGVGLGIMYVVSPYKVKRWVGIASSYSDVFVDRLKGQPYTRGGYDGIDVSKHNGVIKWKEIAKNKRIKFVYIRATHGKGYVDRHYRRNIRLARKYGLKVGSYHLMSAGSSVTAQFLDFQKMVKKGEQDLIPVLDVEEKGIQGRWKGQVQYLAVFRNRTFAWYWRKGRFKQIHEWYNHQGFDVVGIDDFIHISEYLIQSTYG